MENTLSVREYKTLISKTRDLIKKLESNEMDKSDVLELTKFITNTAPKDFDTRLLTPQQAEDAFKDYLLEKEFPNPNYRVLTHYWYQDNNFSSERLEEILKLAIESKFDDFEIAAKEYLLSDPYNTSVLDEDIDEVINNFYKQTEYANEIKELESNCDIYLTDIFHDNIEYDLNVKELLQRSEFDDLTIYFSEDGSKSNTSLVDDFISIFDKPEFLNVPRNTIIDWLLNTQGYTREDMSNESKRKESVFLTTLYEELFDYITEDYMHDCYLIAVPASRDFDTILNLAKREPVIIKKNTRFGLFNRFMGDGCGLSITLEKDILVDDKTPEYEITYQYSNKFGNYSPIAVYGYGIRCTGKNTLEIPNN